MCKYSTIPRGAVTYNFAVEQPTVGFYVLRSTNSSRYFFEFIWIPAVCGATFSFHQRTTTIIFPSHLSQNKSRNLVTMANATKGFAAYWAQQEDANDIDDETILFGSHHTFATGSFEYSKAIAGSISSPQKHFPELPNIASDESYDAEDESRHTIFRRFTKKKKPGLFQRATGAFRRRKQKKLSVRCDVEEETVHFVCAATSTEESLDNGCLHEKAENKLRPSLIHDLDDISDGFSDASDQCLEVFQRSPSSSSFDNESQDYISHVTLPNDIERSSEGAVIHPETNEYPEGLLVRTSPEEMIFKFKLGVDGLTAIGSVEDAAAAAEKSFDPSNCEDPSVVPTLVTIAGYAVPDYATYVRQKVDVFRKNVLEMSDEIFELLQKRRSRSLDVAVSKLRLLPVAVELHCLEQGAMLNN